MRIENKYTAKFITNKIFFDYRVCQVFCVSFEKIFWGGEPPRSYVEMLSEVNSLKRSLKVLPSHRLILVLLDKQQSGTHMLRRAGQSLHPDQLRPASLTDDLYFPIFHEGSFSESSILVFANPLLDLFVCTQLITDKSPVALRPFIPFLIQLIYP